LIPTYMRAGHGAMSAYNPPGPWRSEAACRGLDPNLFHPERGEDNAKAKAVCASCPSVQPCAIYAISAPDLKGVWGGLTEEERTAARRVLGRMRNCPECGEAFHAPVQSSPYCGDECRHAVRLRSKAESHARYSREVA
jgi:WhiB family redox-sensing transcriptional regulator